MLPADAALGHKPSFRLTLLSLRHLRFAVLHVLLLFQNPENPKKS